MPATRFEKSQFINWYLINPLRNLPNDVINQVAGRFVSAVNLADVLGDQGSLVDIAQSFRCQISEIT